MLYQLTLKYHGDTFIKSPFKLVIEPYYITIECNTQKIVNKIIVQKRVIDYEKYIPKFETTEHHKHSLTIPENPHFDDIINLLQAIESFGSFWFKVKKIEFDFPKREWIAENDKEKSLIKILNIDFSKEYDKTPIEMTPEKLSEIIISRNKFKHLIIPMAFVRVARNDFESFKYINAFINYYYYLEDLYGQGNTKNYLVEDTFMKSKHIQYALDKTISTFSQRHIANLKKFLKIENCEFSNEGIIKLIVKVRGNLHHFSQKSSKMKGHPFNQNEFETIAYLMMSICINTFTKLLMEIEPT